MKLRILSLLPFVLLAACSVAPSTSSPSMVEGSPAVPPSGFVDYCTRVPVDCSPVSNSEPVAMTAERFAQLTDTLWIVRTSFHYMSDQEQYGRKEYWTLPTEAGDCEDLVLAMRKGLLDKGWSPSALRMAAVVTERGQNHLVLVAVTDKGDYVLDNRQERVLGWRDLPYSWISRQDARLREWLRL